MNYRFVAAGILCALIACQTGGTKVNSDLVGSIRKGVTTQDEISRIYGAPTSRAFDANGVSIWTYTERGSRSADTGVICDAIQFVVFFIPDRWMVCAPFSANIGQTKVKQLRVYFDTALLVQDFTYSETNEQSAGIR